MPSVTIILTDTPTGSVSVQSTFTPAVGQPCSPAQSVALEVTRLVRRQWSPCQEAPVAQAADEAPQ